MPRCPLARPADGYLLPAYGETLAVELERFNIRVMISAPGSFTTKFNVPTRSDTPLEGYKALRNYLDEFVPKYAKVPKGDPALGMDALVDAVRGEGRAAGHGPLHFWLFLGEDSMQEVRARAETLLSALEEWKDVGSNLDLPVERPSV
jgi:NAD(P)-dependent dehydrogenase (short-subunit alcohol dehydrogenase family)